MKRRTQKELNKKVLTLKVEKEHSKTNKRLRIFWLIVIMPTILPLCILEKIGEGAETIEGAIQRWALKRVHNAMKILYYDECRTREDDDDED